MTRPRLSESLLHPLLVSQLSESGLTADALPDSWQALLARVSQSYEAYVAPSSPAMPPAEATSHSEGDYYQLRQFQEGVNACFRELLTHPESPDVLERAFQNILESTGLDRIYVFENFEQEGRLFCRMSVEVCSPGISVQITDPAFSAVPYDAISPRWRETMEADGVLAGLVEDFPESEQEGLRAQEIQSLVLVPIYRGSEWVGMMGFDDVCRRRIWQEEHIRLLRTLANLYVLHQKNQEYLASIRQALADKEVMLAEIHHRVKNNLAVVSSLISLQARDISDPAVLHLFRECQGRIRAMALIHEKLYRSHSLAQVDFGAYIRDLLASFKHSLPQQACEIRADIQAEHAELNINQAVPCGLLVNELISNAYKHAFVGRERGVLSVSLSTQPDKYVLEVADNGIGIPDEVVQAPSQTLGMTLIQALTQQLGGKLSFENAQGTCVRLEFAPSLT